MCGTGDGCGLWWCRFPVESGHVQQEEARSHSHKQADEVCVCMNDGPVTFFKGKASSYAHCFEHGLYFFFLVPVTQLPQQIQNSDSGPPVGGAGQTLGRKDKGTRLKDAGCQSRAVRP